jgi:Na+/proline symporter
VGELLRSLLNSLPEWALALLFIGGVVLVTLGAFRLVQRFLQSWRDTSSVEGIVAVAAMVMTLYALVLAFVVVNLYNDYADASTDVIDAANALGAVVQDAQALPGGDRNNVERAVTRYIGEVRAREFSRLADGNRDPAAQRRASDIFVAAQRVTPATETQRVFYRAAADQLNTFLAERENRIAKAGTSIPPPLLGLMVFLGMVTIAVFLLIRTHHASLDIALIVTVAIVVASGLLTALILQYPYSGSIAVQSDTFTHGALSQPLAG